MRTSHFLKSLPTALAILAIAGVLFLAQPAQAAYSLFEGFESTAWPVAPWITQSGSGGATSTAAVHDGARGWINTGGGWYRSTSGPSVGAPTQKLRWWTRKTTNNARSYLCWGASAAGTQCVVFAPNTNTLLLQRNPGFGFIDVASIPFPTSFNTWYRIEAQFNSNTSVTARAFASDGVTLLAQVTGTFPAFSPGGVAIRMFGTHQADTIEFDSGCEIGVSSLTPTSGVTNPTDCCRTETFNVALTGTLPISYTISIVPPAGGSATPVPGGTTSTGSISFTSTLCAGTNVPPAGKSFAVTINASNTVCSASLSPSYVLRDTTPPSFASGGSPLFCVWPPNHNWMSANMGTGPGQVDPSGRATDNCTVSSSMAYSLAAPISDEPANGTGDGDTDVDTGVSPDGRTIFFRAERSGGGDGREYAVQGRATDAAGNSSTGTIGSIEVPHDSSEDKNCVNSTKLGDK